MGRKPAKLDLIDKKLEFLISQWKLQTLDDRVSDLDKGIEVFSDVIIQIYILIIGIIIGLASSLIINNISDVFPNANHRVQFYIGVWFLTYCVIIFMGQIRFMKNKIKNLEQKSREKNTEAIEFLNSLRPLARELDSVTAEK